jgi:hypothetical protein
MEITKNTRKEEIIKIGEECGQCGKCCLHQSGFLIDSDLNEISSFLGITNDELKREYLVSQDLFGKIMYRPKIVKNEKAFGPCIFLENEKVCKIHNVKPFMCKIGCCNKYGNDIMEWFMLNYVVMPYNKASIMQWSTRIKTHPTIKGGSVDELIPDKDIRKKLLLVD